MIEQPNGQFIEQTMRSGAVPGGRVEAAMATVKEIAQGQAEQYAEALKLQEAKKMVEGSNASVPVKDRVANIADRIGKTVNGFAERKQKQAEAAKAAREKHDAKAQEIIKKRTKSTGVDMGAQVLQQYASEFGPEYVVGVDKGNVLKRAAESIQNTIDTISLGFHEARAKANAQKEAKRAKHQAQYSLIATGLANWAAEARLQMGTVNTEFKTQSAATVAQVEEGLKQATDSVGDARARYDALTGKTAQAYSTVARSEVMSKDPGAVDQQQRVVEDTYDALTDLATQHRNEE